MSVPTPLPSPARVRTEFGPPPWREYQAAKLLHSGRSTLVFAGADDRLLIITSAAAGLSPGGICLPNPREFEAILAATASTPSSGGLFDLSHWSPQRTVESLVLGWRQVSPRAAAVMSRALDALAAQPRARGLAGMDPAPARHQGRELVEALVSNDIRGQRLPAALAGLVGLGPGTTPSGDDVIVGVLAGLRITGAGQALDVMGTLVAELLHRTGRASRHYLRAALAGRFAEHVHELAEGLADEGRAPRAILAASQWGASSGLDLASGMLHAVAVQASSRQRIA